MPKITAPNQQAFELFVKNPAVGDPDVPAAPLELGLKETLTHDLMDGATKVGSVSFTVDAKSSVAFINDPKDPDPEELFDFGAKEEGKQDAAALPELAPPITFDANKAYVVVTAVSASGKLTGKGESGSIGLGLDASAKLSCAYCREFARTAPVFTAVTSSLASFKSLFDIQELAKLEPEETATLGIGGKLKLSLTLTSSGIADAISSGVQSVLVKAGAVEVSGVAKLAISFEVEGGYRVHARHAKPGVIQFTVRKATHRATGIEGTLGVTAKLKDADAVLKPVAENFGRITGLPAKLVELAQKKAPLAQLTEEQRQLVERAVEKLKLKDPNLDAWQQVKEALEATQKKVKEILSRKAEAAFSYTWRRTTQQAAVARFTLEGSALARHHKNLLRLDLDALLADRGQDSGVSFDRFMGKKVDTIEFGYGFGLSWGDFTVLKGKDTGTRRFIWQRDLAGDVQAAFLGKRGYEATWLDEKSTHQTEIDASMPTFAPPPPRAIDFELALQVGFTWQDREFRDIAREVADHGLLLGALPGTDVAAATIALYEAGLPTKLGGRAVVSLQVPAAATSAVLATIAASPLHDLWASALARALPCGRFGESIELPATWIVG